TIRHRRFALNRMKQRQEHPQPTALTEQLITNEGAAWKVSTSSVLFEPNKSALPDVPAGRCKLRRRKITARKPRRQERRGGGVPRAFFPPRVARNAPPPRPPQRVSTACPALKTAPSPPLCITTKPF